jgi:hypothetical protein
LGDVHTSANATGRREAGLSALSDQAALECRKRTKHVKNRRPFAVVVSGASVKPRNFDGFDRLLHRTRAAAGATCFWVRLLSR